MKMFNYLGFVFLLSFVFIACQKEELQIIDVSASNHDGGVEVPIGGTISVDFDALAGEAALDFYHLEIHDHPASGLIEDEYKIIDDDFKGKSTFKGLRNAHVHEHITVPAEANLGDYHVVIVVVDEAGYSVDTEDLETHIKIVEN
jgi:hypothetical protein